VSGEDEAVPAWASTLRETVARIDERTKQIPDLAEKLDDLRRTTVPLSEHQELAARVDQLWNRDLGARQEWDEMVPRTKTLWHERTEQQGARKAQGRWLAALYLVVAVLTAWMLLRGLGVNVTLGGH
jgi:hypothetical protein